MESKKQFGTWLKERRRRLDLTQQQLAECANCSVVTIRKLEADERRPSEQLGMLLAECLRIPAAAQSAFIAFARSKERTELFVSDGVIEPTPQIIMEVDDPNLVHNQPHHNTPFVGRQTQLREIAQRLADPHCTLLTLVGPGGTGKTRLAVEAASAYTGQAQDGVYFVPLAAITAFDYLVAAIANALNFTFVGDVPVREQLLRFLRSREMLLVLDNFEHLLVPEAAPKHVVKFLSDIMMVAPQIKMLVTSRERLMLQGEWVYKVAGMSYPRTGTVVGKASALRNSYGAINLFVACARRVRADFVLDVDNLPAVVRICQIVDGMPLGIELAATWLHTLSVAEIASEITQNLDLLASQLRDVEERHRSLRTVFEYSLQRLPSSEQNVLKKLSVFQGGFDREAAQKVAGASLFYLSSLVNKSLVTHSSHGRYEIHELLRQFCLEKLREQAGEEAATRDRHSKTFADFMKVKWQEISGVREAEALADIEENIDNVRAGWHWALEQRRWELLDEYVVSLSRFYEIRAWHEEGMHTFRRAVEALAGAQRPEEQQLLAKLSTCQAIMCQYLVRLEEAQALLDTSLALAEQLGSDEEKARALLVAGGVAIFKSEREDALDYFRQALDVYEPLSDHYGQAAALSGLVWANLESNDLDLARQYLQKCLKLTREMGPKSILAWTLFNMSDIAYSRGDYEEAWRYLEESRAVCEEIDYQFALLSCLTAMGTIAHAQGQIAQAKTYFQAGLALRSRLGEIHGIAGCLMMLASIAVELNELEEAEIYLQKLLAFQETYEDDDVPLGWYHYVSGELALRQKRLREAAEHFRSSVQILRPTRRSSSALLSILGLGKTYYALKDYVQAEQSFMEALDAAMTMSWTGFALDSLCWLGMVQGQRGEMQDALELLSVVQRHPATTKETRVRARRCFEALDMAQRPNLLSASDGSQSVLDLETVVKKLRSGQTDGTCDE